MDPRTLGRPVHLLPRFVEPLRDELAEALRADLNRRYRASFALGAVAIVRLEASPEQCRWLYASGPKGCTGFALERPLLLGILDYRYGIHDGASPASGSDKPQPETVSEERLAHRLAVRFLKILSAHLNPASPTAEGKAAPGALEIQPGASPKAGSWAIRAEISEEKLALHGALWFSLDDACIQAILSLLTPRRDQARKRAAPLATQLRLKVTGRLVEREVTLGSLLDLRVGSVIPVSLGAADVLIDDSRLFSAQVAEHKGKLCLTAFEDVE
jgi:flagellar motor switch protein FliM